MYIYTEDYPLQGSLAKIIGPYYKNPEEIVMYHYYSLGFNHLRLFIYKQNETGKVKVIDYLEKEEFPIYDGQVVAASPCFPKLGQRELADFYVEVPNHISEEF